MRRRGQQVRLPLLRKLAARLMFVLLLSGLVLHAHAESGVAVASGVTLSAVADQGHCLPTTAHAAGECPAAHSCGPSHAGCSALLVALSPSGPGGDASQLPAGRLIVVAWALAPPSPPPIASSEA